MNNQSSKKSKTKIIVIALCVVAGLAIIGYATGSKNICRVSRKWHNNRLFGNHTARLIRKRNLSLENIYIRVKTEEVE